MYKKIVFLCSLILMCISFSIDVENPPVSSGNIATSLPSWVVTDNYSNRVSINNDIYAQQIHPVEIVFTDGTVLSSASSNILSISGISSSKNILIHADTLDVGSYNIILRVDGTDGLTLTSKNVTFGVTLNAQEAILNDIVFNANYTPNGAVRSFYWDETNKTMTIRVSTESTLQVGQENWIRCVNKSGATIADGKAVYLSGAQGNRPTIELAIANTNMSSRVIGLATETISDNEEGMVTVMGIVNGVDTRAYSDGAVLYLSPTVSGDLTTTIPDDPNYVIRIGQAMNTTVKGSIFVHPDVGFSIDQLYSVSLNQVTSGQILVVDNTGLWKNTTLNYLNNNLVINGGLSVNIFNVGLTINKTSFDNTGYMSATGSAMSWDDVAYMAVHPVKDVGAGSLTLKTITGNIQGWAFAVNEYCTIQSEFSHRWKPTSPVSIHIHAMNKSTNVEDRFMKFQLEYSWADLNGVVTTPTIISNNFTVPANDPINTAYYIELANKITPPPSSVSAHLLGRLTRVTATGTAVASDPIVLSFGVHGQIDSLGSRTEYTK